MDILVTANKTLGKIASEFSAHFPYLRLEFFNCTHAPGTAIAGKDRLPAEITVSEAGDFDHDECLSIDGDLKVGNLEARFEELFGIGVQVLRKSGNLWLQTTTTDHWTLAKQNREGRFDSMPV